MGSPKSILFIRRDNIGDLVCTTPAIASARKAFPGAKIGVLVNSYNADVLAGNPDIDLLHVYSKAKHSPERNRLSVWAGNAGVLLGIRRQNYDVAIGCGSYSPRLERYTRLTGAGRRVGYERPGGGRKGRYTIGLREPGAALHEVERTFALLGPLGISGPPPPMRVYPAGEALEGARRALRAAGFVGGRPLVSFHISSRRPENRWQAERFIELGAALHARLGAEVILLWSPGSGRDVRHPGDDEKAVAVARALDPRPFALRTTRLGDLIAALSISDLVVCSDGGAMHVAAALGKPLAVVWGSTDRSRWAPWGTPHELIGGTGRAQDVTVQEALDAVCRLMGRPPGG